MRVALVIAASLLVACGSSVPAAAPAETTVAATPTRSLPPSSAAQTAAALSPDAGPADGAAPVEVGTS